MTGDKGVAWQIELLGTSYDVELAKLEGKSGREHNQINRKRHDRMGFLGRVLARKYGPQAVEVLKADGLQRARDDFKKYNRVKRG